VFDWCMDNGIRFDLGIGVSAGSANLASYAAGQRGRNFRFYTEYAFRHQYMGLGNFISKRSLFDLDYVYGTLSCSDGEDPLDYDALRDNPMEFHVVATDAHTGKAVYFSKDDIAQDDYGVFKCSSAIPFFCHSYAFRGSSYYDGALGDPVPIEKAFELGCDRVVLILTKPENELRRPDKDMRIASLIRGKYPEAARSLCQRAGRYNESVSIARSYEKDGRVLIISPDDTCGVDTLRRNKRNLISLYDKGYEDGRRIGSFMNGGTGDEGCADR
ncbi:MAG: patatin family protein, partial [Candidatus Ornithospirochaeta sp.]|nr:patatin family protein [Candidatus Ornithospirochaeta sp.]